MKDVTFTPGPWKAVYIGSSDWDVLDAAGNDVTTAGDVGAQAKPNAYLIAAAPDLYEALHDLVHGRISDSAKATEAARQRRRDAWENAKAALAKARLNLSDAPSGQDD